MPSDSHQSDPLSDGPVAFFVGVDDEPAPRRARPPGPDMGRFVDEVTLTAESGKGGAGCVAWRREKYIRRGGPAGGDGGRGGDVVFVGDEGLSTLLDLKRRRFLRAPKGRPGGPAKCTGAGGEDLVVPVPVGTLVHDRSSGELLADITVAGQRAVVCKGGRGGRGNASFVSSTRRSPEYAQPGEAGETRELKLTLKLLADVGIVGLPNAGKSTFISHVSNARPRVADYPFTTLVPQLGVVEAAERSFVVADIPGLIEGAADGAGLGTRFLRHVERTGLFLFLLDVGPDRPDPAHSLALLERELERYDPELAGRERLVALNKVDLPEVREQVEPLRARLAERDLELYPVSAATGEGLRPLLYAMAARVGRI